MNSRPAGEPIPDNDRILADLFAEDAPPYEPPLLIPALLARTALTRQRPAWRVPSWWALFTDLPIRRLSRFWC